MINGWYIDDGSDQYFPEVMTLLRTAPNLTNVFEAVAASMSNAVRAGGDGGLHQEGELCEQATIYRIQWRWITLPLLVVVAALIQLVLSIFRSARTQTPLWKSNSLAVLSRGHVVTEILGTATTLSDMETAAKDAEVTLFPEWQNGRVSKY